MDEYMWVWMYQSWLQDQEETHKTYKDYALFLGSFFNSEMAQSIIKLDDPDFSASDEDFEKSTEYMLNQKNIELSNIRHRRRRVAKQQMFDKKDE
jgi:hypothetical protein